MVEGVDTIRQRLELARELPESVDSKNTAANRWIEDVTLLLAENDRLQAVVEAARKDAEFDDLGCECLTHRGLAALDKET